MRRLRGARDARGLKATGLCVYSFSASLRDVSSADNDYSSLDILAWACQLIEALEVLARAQIYHGDLRLPNLLLSPTGHIIVADFGVRTHEQAVPSNQHFHAITI